MSHRASRDPRRETVVGRVRSQSIASGVRFPIFSEIPIEQIVMRSVTPTDPAPSGCLTGRLVEQPRGRSGLRYLSDLRHLSPDR
jgi:hypothetical protein